MVNKCNAEQPFSELKVVEWTKEHRETKQAGQRNSKEYRALTSIWNTHYH